MEGARSRDFTDLKLSAVVWSKHSNVNIFLVKHATVGVLQLLPWFCCSAEILSEIGYQGDGTVDSSHSHYSRSVPFTSVLSFLKKRDTCLCLLALLSLLSF